MYRCTCAWYFIVRTCQLYRAVSFGLLQISYREALGAEPCILLPLFFCVGIVEQPCLTGRQSSKTRTCRRRCSRMPWNAQPRPLRSTTLKKTLLPTSRRSLTRSTIPLGIALWAGISAVM